MGTSDISNDVHSVSPADPQVYAFTAPGVTYLDGWIKIGYTEINVDKRIKQITHTAGVKAHKEWQGHAYFQDDPEATFRDHDFHRYLRKLNIERDPSTEYFFITPDESQQHFIEFRSNRGILDVPSASEYTLRSEQDAAVVHARDYAQLHDDGEFLWNAKPRFGKTLSAYDLCKRLDAGRVLIVTNRPTIANSWYDDYVKFLGAESGYRFVSNTEALAYEPYVMTREEYEQYIIDHPEEPEHFIEFVSLQDLKGSKYLGEGIYDKLKDVAETTWDILIIDEAHEGVDTLKSEVVFRQIKRKFTLHLSGTPFKALADAKFPENAIYNWTYADEQQAKRKWDNPELSNPYADLPQLNMFTYQMSDVVADELSQGIEINGETEEYAFDLNEFFETDGRGCFKHNDSVDRFLDALTTQKKFPFSTPELRNDLRHTLWILNRVDSARALARKLQAHSVFGDYKIVLAAGDGRLDDEEENVKAINKVRNAISNYDKTITLSVGQLTTGVTIPEWTAVLMLSNMHSPSLYMQAAFRAQNPCLFYRDGQFWRKENAYVFDFDPARTLTIFEKFANDLSADTVTGKGDMDARKEHIRTLLNFFPVIGEDDSGEMTELDAEEVLSIPRKIRSREVVRRGFMSNYLFQNVSNLFHMPKEAIDIIETLEPYKEPSEDLGITHDTAEELCINSDGEVEIPEERIIGIARDLFGDKIFEDASVELGQAIEKAVREYETDDDERAALDILSHTFKAAVTDPALEIAEGSYRDVLSARQKARIGRDVQAGAEKTFKLQCCDYRSAKEQIEKSREEQLEQAESPAEIKAIEREYDERRQQAQEDFQQNLRSTCEELIQKSGPDIVEEMETAKLDKQKQDIEDNIRDHLRGFSRTIPSFLMAYGDEETTLENFGERIPEHVFEEVTSITYGQFLFLRDGGPCKNALTGETEHFEGHLFDPIVFDDSVKEFIRLRTELADYFDESQEGDIFDYVPPQKNNQIFTPRRVVVQMVDMLEEENPGCFDDPTHTFADLYMKSGLYLTEIIKRLYNSKKMKKAYPDDRARLDHILQEQIFGIAPTEIIFEIATHFILGYNYEHGNLNDCNFRMTDSALLAIDGELADYVLEEFSDKMMDDGAED